MEEIKGRIIKGLGGLYDVLCGKEVLHCRARGSFRHDKITPYTGDIVTVKDDYILSIEERKNYLTRPPIANLDILFVVAAAKKPAPVTATLDKMISIAEFKKITPVVIITKNDLSPKTADELKNIYSAIGLKVFITEPEADKSELLSFLRDECQNKICAFSGASGVGKSTLLNSLFPSLALSTGEVSSKISRGKHTTRHVELYPLSRLLSDENLTGFIADTPGFSMLDPTRIEDFTKDILPGTFREFVPFIGNCKYTKCTHTKEEGCAVLQAIEEGKIPPSRHQSFLEMYESLKNKHPWD